MHSPFIVSLSVLNLATPALLAFQTAHFMQSILVNWDVCEDCFDGTNETQQKHDANVADTQPKRFCDCNHIVSAVSSVDGKHRIMSAAPLDKTHMSRHGKKLGGTKCVLRSVVVLSMDVLFLVAWHVCAEFTLRFWKPPTFHPDAALPSVNSDHHLCGFGSLVAFSFEEFLFCSFSIPFEPCFMCSFSCRKMRKHDSEHFPCFPAPEGGSMTQI